MEGGDRMISYKQLIKWRKESLRMKNAIDEDRTPEKVVTFQELNERILSLTQELIDQYLIRRKS